MRTGGRWLFLLVAMMPGSAMAQLHCYLTARPPPIPVDSRIQSPGAPFIPAPTCRTARDDRGRSVHRPERRFAFTTEAQLLFPVVNHTFKR